MLRKVVLSSVMLAFLSTPVTPVYATESESINYDVDVNEPKQITNEYENILYIDGTIESINESGEIKVVSKDINGNVTNELTIKNSKYATVYDMKTGEKIDNQTLKVGDEVLVYYTIDEYTNEINATRIFINPDSSNSANSVMFLGDSGSANGTIIDDSANPTKRTFLSQDGQCYVTFDENTELTDVNGNPVSINELNTNDVVLVWYPMMSMSYPAQATATKAILIEDNVKEVKGTETIKLESVIGNDLTTDEAGNTVIQATSFYSSIGGEYVFDTSSQIVDDKGNVLSVSDLKTGDIITVDYVGIEEKGVKKVNVTNAVVDTTDHSVEGTTTIQLGEVCGGGVGFNEDGTETVISATFKSQDDKYKYRMEFTDSTEIVDSEGNPLTIADLQTGDTVTIDYVGEELNGEVEAKATKAVVDTTLSNDEIPVEGTLTVELGEQVGGGTRSNQDGSSSQYSIAFKSSDGKYTIVFEEGTEIVDAEGNPLYVTELSSGNIVTIDYVQQEIDGKTELKATKTVVDKQAPTTQIKGTKTIKLQSEIGQHTSINENGQEVVESVAFYGTGGEYIFPNTLNIIDNNGNKVDITDLKIGDILTVDYVGTQEDNRIQVVVTNAVVDTTDHSVEGTTTIQLGEVSGGGMYEDENGNMVQDAITFKGEDDKYKYRIQFNKFTEIVDSEGNPLTIADLQTGDTVTVDYVGEELNGEVEAKATKAVVEVNTNQTVKEVESLSSQPISSETEIVTADKNQVVGTATVQLSDPMLNELSIDENGNIVQQNVVFFGKDGSSYILPTMLKITDINGNQVNIEDLKSDDILIVDYVGLEVNGHTEAMVTKVVLDTTGYTV